MSVRFVLASANPDKVREMREILDGLELVARPEDVPEIEETADTLEDNARLKAAAICKATGLPAIADDTGFEVDALGGAPGVRAARYAGENATYADNVAKLLAELQDVPEEQRTARYRTVALVLYPDGTEVMAEGTVDGRIISDLRGGGGFGYDPVFVPSGFERTFAQMTADEKHAISHRGRAFRALRERIGS